MQNQINLSVPLIRRIVSELPAINDGIMDIDLGNFGTASIMLGQLQIGEDVLMLPLRFRLRRNSDRDPLEANIELVNWRVSENTIWFTLERIGNLRGPILEVVRRGLIAVISKIVTQHTKSQIRSGRHARELGIPIDSFLARWWKKELPVTISAIQMKNGVTLHLAER